MNLVLVDSIKDFLEENLVENMDTELACCAHEGKLVVVLGGQQQRKPCRDINLLERGALTTKQEGSVRHVLCV